MAFKLEMAPAEIHAKAEELEKQSLDKVLEWTWENFGREAAIGTSFQGSGLVTMDHARKAGFDFPIFTIDTGLLFPETLELKKRLEEYFGTGIESLEPELTVEKQAEEHGPELWNRHPDTCCVMRKVLPLQKKLEEISVWITGLRRHQSDTREQTGILELYKFDVLRDHYILKLNPMVNWSRDQVWNYIREKGIPYNPLQDQGFRSIGCLPCTKPAGTGGDERAGRWTGFDKSECGIHTFLGENI